MFSGSEPSVKSLRLKVGSLTSLMDGSRESSVSVSCSDVSLRKKGG